MDLRPYQVEAIQQVRAAHDRDVRRPLVGLPTGTGKTIVFAHLAKDLVQERALEPAERWASSLLTEPDGARVLILAHRDELLVQAKQKLVMVEPSLGPMCGLVKAETDEVEAQVVIGSVQTLARTRRLQRLLDAGPLDMIVVDEAHHAVADSYVRIIEGLGGMNGDGPLSVGVTATPYRADGKPLGKVWDEVVYNRSILEMIMQGYLCNLRGLAVGLRDIEERLAGVTVRHGDFVEAELGAALEDAGAPRWAVAAYQEHAPGRKALVFTPTVSLSQFMAAEFNRAGIVAEHVDGTTPHDERRAIIARFRTGRTQVLSNVGVLTEGFDESSIDCIILARPTKSNVLFAQIVGRGTRPHPGKEDCLILDLVGDSDRLDLMTLPKLAGVDPKDVAEAEGDLMVAVQIGIDRGVREEREREMVVRQVNLFKRREWHWNQVEPGYWVLSGVERMFTLQIDQEGTWTTRMLLPRGQPPVVLSERLDIGYAMGIAEERLRSEEDETAIEAIARPDARWRGAPPTDRQRSTLRSFGIELPKGATRGDASDMIAVQFARVRSRQ